MTSSISSAEISALRFYLGFGALSVAANTYTSDGFQELFEQVIAPNLTSGAETSIASAVPVGFSIVSPANMVDIRPYAQLIVDVADDAEIVTVQSVTSTTFSARFARAHAAGVPVALMSGLARLRYLLHRADQAWQAMQDTAIGATAGLKQVDRGDVEWFGSFQVLKDRLDHYRAIVNQISSLVRVQPAWAETTAAPSTLESY